MESRSVKTQDFTINLSLFNQLVVSSDVKFNNYLQSYPKRPYNFFGLYVLADFFFFFFFFNHLSRQSALPVSLLLQFQKESFENILTLRFIITIFFFGQNMVLFSLYYNVSNTRIFFFFLQPRVKFASFECYFYLN